MCSLLGILSPSLKTNLEKKKKAHSSAAFSTCTTLSSRPCKPFLPVGRDPSVQWWTPPPGSPPRTTHLLPGSLWAGPFGTSPINESIQHVAFHSGLLSRSVDSRFNEAASWRFVPSRQNVTPSRKHALYPSSAQGYLGRFCLPVTETGSAVNAHVRAVGQAPVLNPFGRAPGSGTAGSWLILR